MRGRRLLGPALHGDRSASAGAITACGGGARSGEWARIFAGVLGRDLDVCDDAVGIRGAAQTAWHSLGTPVDAAAWRAPRRTVPADAG